MKIIIMAGGYAKRMWPLTENQPKALLPVAGKPMINHIIEKLDGIETNGNIIISTNSKFGDAFREWERDHPQSFDIVVEPTMSEEEKFGSIGAIRWLIKEKGIDDDILIVGGDNLFEFNIKEFLRFQKEKNTPLIALHDLGDIEKVRNRYGVCILDNDNKITELQEKPTEPRSTLTSTCVFYFPKEVISHIDEYLAGNNNPDAPGFFNRWLSERTPVHGFVFSEPWHDIGSLEVYEQVNKKYREKP
jgi:glucose-1-phosphate thymidylyltransferase